MLEERTLLEASGLSYAPQPFIDPHVDQPLGLLVRFQAESMGPARQQALEGTALGDMLPMVGGLRQVRLTDSRLSLDETLAAYRAHPDVLYAEPDYPIRLQQTPDDPSYSSLWALNNTGQSGGTADADIDAPEAWDLTTGNNSVVVAVIDTGVDYEHADLAPNIWTNPGEVPGDSIDNDHNGFVDDIHGYDFVNNDSDPMDDHSHGTHVAGTIGAVGNNRLGVTGVNWQVQIMSLKFLDSSGSGSTSDAIRALDYAVRMGAQVSNNSYGDTEFSVAFQDALNGARQAGHVFVAAAGNNGTNNDLGPFYPASYGVDNVIAVAASDQNDRLASFSNYGVVSVDLAAPGVNILSTAPDNTYASNSGTSMASPHVTGVVALVRAMHPDWPYRQVIDQVLDNVDYVPAFEGRVLTSGRLNAAMAVGVADREGPRVLRSDPSGGIGGVISTLRLTFQESIDPLSFQVDDLDFTGPEGPIPILGVSGVPGSRDRRFDITFQPQAAYGVYTLLVGPQIRDLAGNDMDQNRNGIAGERPSDQYPASFTLGNQFVFTSADVPKPLLQFAVTTSAIAIDEDLDIADVDVRLDADYPDVGLLDVSLLSPWGTKIILAPTRGFLGPDYENTVFDDEAELPIASGSPPYAGSFQPASPLSVLEGHSARGTWQLRVSDLWFHDGTLNSWTLSVLANPPRLSISDVTVAEGDSGITQVNLSVSLSNTIGEPIMVDFSTVDGTALGGSDYEASHGTLTFLPGELTKTIGLAVFGDTLDEPDETFLVKLANARGATIADEEGRATLRNDETDLAIDDVDLLEGDTGSRSAVFTVTLAAPSAQVVTVSYATADGTAVAIRDYTATSGVLTFAPGETSKQVAVPLKVDAADEPDEWFFLDLTDSHNAPIVDGQGQATLRNDDPLPSLSVEDATTLEGDAGTKNMGFVVRLSTSSGRTVTVPYAFGSGTATPDQDYAANAGLLTFLPGQLSRTLNVTLIGDGTAEPDESLLLNLGTPVNAVLLDPQAVGTIANDDTSIIVSNLEVAEGNSGSVTVNLDVRLSQAVAFPVVVDYATDNGTATAGSDFVATQGRLIFEPGQSHKTIAVTVIGDQRNEGVEDFAVALTHPSNALLVTRETTVTIDEDDPLPVISVVDATMAEGQDGTKTLTFDFSLSSPSGRSVKVDFFTQDQTATAGSDYTARSGTLSFTAGATTARLSIVVNGDTDYEGDESFALCLRDPVNAALAEARAQGTILEDDSLRIGDLRIVETDEGMQQVAFIVSLSSPRSDDVSFDYATANGTAVAGDDYVATSGRATIPAGETSTDVTVMVLGDPGKEADESFYVNLSNPEGAILADGQALASLIDNDPLPTLTIADVSLIEYNSSTKNAIFRLALSAVSGQTITVDYTTRDATATAGSDYIAKSGKLTWYAGSQTQMVSVAVIGDTLVEPDESFVLELSNPVNVEVLKTQALARIVSDDPLPALTISDAIVAEGNSGTKKFTFSVKLSAVSNQTVTVQYRTEDVSAIAGSDYVAQTGTLTFAPKQVSKSIFVTVMGDAFSEPDEDFLLSLFGATNAVVDDAQGLGTIANDDLSITIDDAEIEEQQSLPSTAILTVTLSAPASYPVSVGYATADHTAAAGRDYLKTSGTLVFAPGEAAKTIRIPVVDDRLNEAEETFFVELDNPVSAQVVDNRAAIIIRDDDPLPTIFADDAWIAEGASGTKNLQFSLHLSAASGQNVTVNYATTDGAATGDSDFVPKTGSVTFLPGITTQKVSVTINGDGLPEPNETLRLILSSASNATLVDDEAIGTVLDDDNLSVSSGVSLEGNSGAASLVFAVRLATPLPYEVQVDYATGNDSATAGSDFVATSGTLVFSPGETVQPITVLVLGDDADELDETLLLNLSNATGILLAEGQARGVILDDDDPPIVSITDVVLTEGNAGMKNASFTVSLSAVSGRTVTVGYTTADGTALAGLDYVGTAGTLTFYPGSVSKTISVSINGDFDAEPNEFLLVRLSSPSGAVLGDSVGQGIVVDDDGNSASLEVPPAQSALGKPMALAPLVALSSDLLSLLARDRAASDVAAQDTALLNRFWEAYGSDSVRHNRRTLLRTCSHLAWHES